MTITIDGKQLNVTHLTEAVEAVAVESDDWRSEGYKRKIRIFGKIRRWTLDCVEKDIAWTDSAANHLQQLAENGTAVSFVIDEGNRHQVNTQVYVLNVQVTLDLVGTQNIRHFIIQLQEAM